MPPCPSTSIFSLYITPNCFRACPGCFVVSGLLFSCSNWARNFSSRLTTFRTSSGVWWFFREFPTLHTLKHTHTHTLKHTHTHTENTHMQTFIWDLLYLAQPQMIATAPSTNYAPPSYSSTNPGNGYVPPEAGMTYGMPAHTSFDIPQQAQAQHMPQKQPMVWSSPIFWNLDESKMRSW